MKKNERFKNAWKDTNTFHFYNANPKENISADCVVRSISFALDQSWEDTLREMTELGIKYGYVFNEPKLYSRYLKQKGWTKMKQPKHLDNSRFTGKEFCENIAEDGKKYILHIGSHHTSLVVNKQIYDIWNCSNRTVGNYWCKE